MTITEATLRKGFVDELRSRVEVEVTRIEDTLTSGIPDICVSGLALGLWIETKLAKNGRVKSKGIQRLTLHRLGRVCPAYMLVWDFDDDQKTLLTTLIDWSEVPLQGPITTPAVLCDYEFVGPAALSHKTIVDHLIRTHA